MHMPDSIGNFAAGVKNILGWGGSRPDHSRQMPLSSMMSFAM